MKQHLVKIESIALITHDVLKIVTEKPADYWFTPGQAVEVSLNNDGWKGEKRPFTFTATPEMDYLEFTIKTYPSHRGVTNELLSMRKGDELILHDVFGEIAYKGEGVFIAGGAGITPFICILRDLKSKKEIGDNKLIFANNMRKDIILEKEFERLLGKNFIRILTHELIPGYAHGLISEEFLKPYIDNNKFVYLCGPPPMMDTVEKLLVNLNVDTKLIIKERF